MSQSDADMSGEIPREIPEEIKRQVRQRCGFGCVFDGHPIFDYDHIQEWSEVREHTAENITLLCPQCHREKTAGRLDVAQVRAANAEPFNRQGGYTPPYRWGARPASEMLTMKLGSNWFSNPHVVTAIVIDEQPMLQVSRDEDGALVFDAVLFDRFNDVSLVIAHNQLQVNTENWDVSFEGTNLIVRNGPGLIAYELELTQEGVDFRRGHVWFNGVDVEITPDGFSIFTPDGRDDSHAALTARGNHTTFPVGLALGSFRSPPPAMIRYERISRYPTQQKLRGGRRT